MKLYIIPLNDDGTENDFGRIVTEEFVSVQDMLDNDTFTFDKVWAIYSGAGKAKKFEGYHYEYTEERYNLVSRHIAHPDRLKE